MNTTILRLWDLGTFQTANLPDFCRQLGKAYAIRFADQGISWQFEVPQDLSFDLPFATVRKILAQWIEEALDAMPDGGELDLTVVRSSLGLEIELADSRSMDDGDAWRSLGRSMAIGRATSVQRLAEDTLLLEAMMCPQGGVARTVIIPHKRSAAVPLHENYRRVA